jgi:hypothetical protein
MSRRINKKKVPTNLLTRSARSLEKIKERFFRIYEPEKLNNEKEGHQCLKQLRCSLILN